MAEVQRVAGETKGRGRAIPDFVSVVAAVKRLNRWESVVCRRKRKRPLVSHRGRFALSRYCVGAARWGASRRIVESRANTSRALSDSLPRRSLPRRPTNRVCHWRLDRPCRWRADQLLAARARLIGRWKGLVAATARRLATAGGLAGRSAAGGLTAGVATAVEQAAELAQQVQLRQLEAAAAAVVAARIAASRLATASRLAGGFATAGRFAGGFATARRFTGGFATASRLTTAVAVAVVTQHPVQQTGLGRAARGDECQGEQRGEEGTLRHGRLQQGKRGRFFSDSSP